jgi:hypothetical protein
MLNGRDGRETAIKTNLSFAPSHFGFTVNQISAGLMETPWRYRA